MRNTWDWLLLAQIISVGLISLLIIFSINSSLATNQFIYWILGLITLYITSQFNYHSLKGVSNKMYFATLISLILLLIFADPIRGSVRWIDLGAFRIQPSEIAKVASIILLAFYYKDKSAKEIQNVIGSFLLILPLTLFIIIQPDIGNSLAIFAIWLGITVASGLKFKYLFLLFAIGAIILILSYELLAPYQKNRILTFIDPNIDPLGTGYNIIQSKIAIGSGQLLGRGFAQGTQSQLKFLPEAESDFIFASITEQLGFAGAAVLTTIYAWLIIRIISFTKDKDRLGQLILIGITTFLVTQFTVNVGMNLALLPVTGITFPLVSYGGSSLLTTLFLLGIVYSILRHNH
ncbi:MAG: Rod shape-determining protein RodA [Candidatus Curtissbacteria bacterium GW2011_GWA1_40_9]|uniref:Rod shape-determining protein RodA n=1 Tax=Candidatus Curtissbacteria bacterium GW2011_GWA1_40_9 TaxID=1618408 RepID=A0A0G0TMF4_9BACT|nr:MAG: Rod shape-determining protein RodA [Candidatus Curtissbacteria bacterium GW2011_GWA1_40_9]